MKVGIWDVTAALWSKLVVVVNPQCTQSDVPNVVRLIAPLVVALDPLSVPLPGTGELLTVREVAALSLVGADLSLGRLRIAA